MTRRVVIPYSGSMYRETLRIHLTCREEERESLARRVEAALEGAGLIQPIALVDWSQEKQADELRSVVKIREVEE